jgi:hypothetical protein
MDVSLAGAYTAFAYSSENLSVEDCKLLLRGFESSRQRN